MDVTTATGKIGLVTGMQIFPMCVIYTRPLLSLSLSMHMSLDIYFKILGIIKYQINQVFEIQTI